MIKYTVAQRAWCDTYHRETGFHPMMDSFEAGRETFHDAATRAIRWYETHSMEAHRLIQLALPQRQD
ncbi:hypothetical protein E2P84_43705 [Burkholderia cepacia]|uniref:Uncharacterized protein n=1 Tax=Burkholderia cepacia TaxID=292 RepID=A0AAX2RQR1_BURCE|nr:hypothetical protein [Burkholderia cepacia]TES61338.1 hypothetical protein E2P84_43705 [Burkholderia cepacia]TET01720.1 hypothetical protein E3D36_16935 [Burkholderia cepacia]TEU47578.1 hypothetical protein E3D37_16365 [Burkholderia cepacia]TEU53450.1 hypothetical protein E3D38_11950 [Burkholderia cepacia]TEV02056.1 hypothetical protein E3D40_12880 [Burkholderia cepacia]